MRSTNMGLAGSMTETYTTQRGEQEQQFSLETYTQKTSVLYTCTEITGSGTMARTLSCTVVASKLISRHERC